MANEQLQKVADWERQKEERCAGAFHLAQQYVQQQRDRLSSIERYRIEYIQSITQNGQSGLQARTYTQHLSFVAQLDQACHQQNKIISQAILVADQRKQEWLVQQRKRKAIEHVIEKKRLAREHRLAKYEQQQADEFALQRFIRNASA
ncbi:flagellar export protein FliJ [Alteromonas facilis]|uniref:flagellar export protein FliJ n=1 Tax=Alteromonas facilis TaxID=2048004 RepID=UPI000C28B2B5|nr:flagellar export protein FliJ [Alteromonas facilis]